MANDMVDNDSGGSRRGVVGCSCRRLGHQAGCTFLLQRMCQRRPGRAWLGGRACWLMWKRRRMAGGRWATMTAIRQPGRRTRYGCDEMTAAASSIWRLSVTAGNVAWPYARDRPGGLATRPRAPGRRALPVSFLRGPVMALTHLPANQYSGYRSTQEHHIVFNTQTAVNKMAGRRWLLELEGVLQRSSSMSIACCRSGQNRRRRPARRAEISARAGVSQLSFARMPKSEK